MDKNLRMWASKRRKKEGVKNEKQESLRMVGIGEYREDSGALVLPFASRINESTGVKERLSIKVERRIEEDA